MYIYIYTLVSIYFCLVPNKPTGAMSIWSSEALHFLFQFKAGLMIQWASFFWGSGASLELVQSFLEEKGFDAAIQDREGEMMKRATVASK